MKVSFTVLTILLVVAVASVQAKPSKYGPVTEGYFRGAAVSGSDGNRASKSIHIASGYIRTGSGSDRVLLVSTGRQEMGAYWGVANRFCGSSGFPSGSPKFFGGYACAPRRSLRIQE